MNKLLLVACIFLFTSALNAQTIKRLGLRTGFNVSNYYGHDVSSMAVNGHRYENRYGRLPGLNGNFFVEIAISDDISFQPEIAFMLNQYTLDNTLPTYTISTPEVSYTAYNEFHWSFVEQFISIPLLIKAELLNTQWYSMNIQNGISIGWLENRIVSDGGNELDNYIKEGPVNELLALFGIENVFHTSYGDFIINLRYQHKMFNNYKAVSGEILDIRYDTYNVTLGYAYNFRQLFEK